MALPSLHRSYIFKYDLRMSKGAVSHHMHQCKRWWSQMNSIHGIIIIKLVVVATLIAVAEAAVAVWTITHGRILTIQAHAGIVSNIITMFVFVFDNVFFVPVSMVSAFENAWNANVMCDMPFGHIACDHRFATKTECESINKYTLIWKFQTSFHETHSDTWYVPIMAHN